MSLPINIFKRKYKLFVFGAIINLLCLKSFSIQCPAVYEENTFTGFQTSLLRQHGQYKLQISCEYSGNVYYDFAPYYGKEATDVWSYLYNYSGSDDGQIYMVCSGAQPFDSCMCNSSNPQNCKWEL